MILRIIKVSKETAVVEVEGDLCGYFARKTLELLESRIWRGVRSFVLDMKKCSSIDSLGVQLLKNLSIGRLRLVNVDWSTRTICNAERFDLDKVDGFSSIEDALKSLDAKVTTQKQLALCDFIIHNLANYSAWETA